MQKMVPLTHYVLAPLITSIATFILGVFVYFRNKKNSINVIFALYCLSVSFWSYWQALFFQSQLLDTKINALFYARLLHLGAFFIPSIFLHFIFTFLKETAKKRKLIISIYTVSFSSLILIPTTLIIQDVVPEFSFKYIIKPGILYLFYILFFAACVIYGLYRLFKELKKSSGAKRNQIKYLLFGSLFGYIGASQNFLYAFGIWAYPLNPFGTYAVPIYVFIVTYAILRYRLLEVEVVIRKTIVFAGVFGFVFAVFSGAAYLAEGYWAGIIGSRFITMGIAVLLIVLIQEPLKNMLVKYTDRFLLQKKYDYQKVLRDASEGMAMVRETKWLLGLMTHIISSKMRISNIGIFLQDDRLNTDHYYLKARRGKETIQHAFLSKDNPICLWLKENKKALALEDVDYSLQRKDTSATNHSQKNLLTRIKSQMQSLNAKVIIPAFYKGSLLGFLSLGYKLSGDMYTKEDLILLSTLSSSAAVAIENARLFDSLLDEIDINNQLRKEEEDSYLQMMMSLAKTIDAKDSYTYDHVEMVYQYGVDLAEYLPGVNKDALKASLRLHDLGKIGVPDSILSKPGPLTNEEWKKIREHTILGARILAPLKKFEYVAKIILHHQEKFDGTGYPGGLKGGEIPLESRIISVVDAYHAMISDRPYRKALPKETAIAELKRFAGTQFDPIVVDAFLKLLKEKHGITET